ncbi:Myb_DNA-bind_3 domain-containing protein/DDE_4 domain-containing protein/UBN2_2 domain-containing protein [Cephalotus follicularis]|uniref:Myb_DNA-bind_3 domain-containing protein/DDE_4 domain-containing protein/UBN2_2 domain-containing protein n=1 Tax=Cephalotus follicularis TaxID=3775 RepID=A0A1Q3BGJ2_CEPFO|nr:Myb_DNA-bind_3 domain-containing protein/DDE_4 domain-containing protein/UBN2_2 domain-containing protein [Cephalotus follicularis]
MGLKYKDGQSISDHLNEFQVVLDQLSAMNIKFEDEVQGLWLLGTLPDSWETCCMSLSNSAPDGIVTMDFAKNGILNEKMRRKTQGSSSDSEALVVEIWGEVKVKVQEEETRVEANQDKPKSHFTKEAWKSLVETFGRETGRAYDYNKLKNKWDQLKKDYLLWRALLGIDTRLGWDSEKMTVDASDDWWKRRIVVLYFFQNYLYVSVGKYYLVDFGYTPHKGYLSPYKGEGYHLPNFQLGRSPVSSEEIFNYTHSSIRSVIERTFGVWKNKWKIIKTMHSYPLDRQLKIVTVFIRKNTTQDRHFADFDDNPTFVLENELRYVQNEPEGSQAISQKEGR